MGDGVMEHALLEKKIVAPEPVTIINPKRQKGWRWEKKEKPHSMKVESNNTCPLNILRA
jgi:hypothetical protein